MSHREHTRQVQLTRKKNWQAYRNECELRKAMLEGDFIYALEDYLKTYMGGAWDVLKDYYELPEYNNVMADVIGRTVQVYTRPAKRAILIDKELPDTEAQESEGAEQYEEDEVFAGLTENVEFDKALLAVSHYMAALGLCEIRPWVLNGRHLKLQVLTPDEFEPILSYDDPSKMAGIVYATPWPEDSTKRISRYYTWDMEGFVIAFEFFNVATPDVLTDEIRAEFKAKYSGVVESDDSRKMVEENSKIGSDYPYRDEEGEPVLPFVTAAYQAPPNRLVNIHVGRDLYDATLRMGMLEAQLAWLVRNQSHLQVVVRGAGAGELGNRLLMPGTMLPLVGPADETGVDTLDLRTDPSSLQRVKDDILTTLLTRRGWSLDEFKASAARRSAEALLIENEGKTAYLHEFQEYMRPVEHDLMNAVRTVWNADADTGKYGRISEKGRTSVDFDNPFRVNVYVALDATERLVDKNILSVVDVIMDANPDITNRDDAMDMLKRNVEENRKAKGLSREQSMLAAALPPPNNTQPLQGEPNAEQTGQQPPPNTVRSQGTPPPTRAAGQATEQQAVRG
jgi:hypothetical protein